MAEKQTKSKNKLIIILGVILVLIATVFAVVFVVTKNNQQKSISATANDEVTFTLLIQDFTAAQSHVSTKKYTVKKAEGLQTLGDFLVSENLITAEDSEFGRFITAVNDIPSSGNAYWMVYVDGQQSSTGIDQIILENDAFYELRLEAYIAQQSNEG